MPPEILTRYSEPLKRAWKEETERILADMAEMGKATPAALAVLKNFLAAPGKFIRPSLFLFGYEAVDEGKSGKQPGEALVRLAISLELFHVYMLVHDDIIDASESRRGVPSLHRQFAQLQKNEGRRGDAELFGTGMAILMGDILSARAEALWTEIIEEGWVKNSARVAFEELKREVGWGQYCDVLLSQAQELPQYEEIIHVLVEKSGKYSIYRPLELGALATGASPEKLGWVRDFGTNLGIAFQTVDDILGTFGDPKETGKSADSDLVERKCTLLVYFAFRDATPEDRATLDAFFGYREKVPDTVSPVSPTIEEVRGLLRKYKADASARAVAEKHLALAKAALLDSGLSSRYTEALRTFADFIVTRKK